MCFANDNLKLLSDSAISLYKNKKYDKALELFLKIYENGFVSANLLYNIGNTYFRLNNLGKAILFYERAKRLNPNDNDIIYNLNFANALIIDKIEKTSRPFYEEWFKVLAQFFSSNTWILFSIFSFIILLTFIYIFLISYNYILNLLSKILISISILVFIISLSSSYYMFKQCTRKDEAIIIPGKVDVFSSPDMNSTILFELHEGTKVLIINKYENWYEIKIPDGNTGWIISENVEII